MSLDFLLSDLSRDDSSVEIIEENEVSLSVLKKCISNEQSVSESALHECMVESL